MNPPTASIVIRTYNRLGRVDRAIDAALAQDLPEKQIIVIDDGSTDGTGDTLRDRTDIEYYYQENGGLQAGRLAGLAKARGTYLAYLDSDDIWHPDFLSRSISAIERHNAAFSIANYRKLNEYDGGDITSAADSVPALRALQESSGATEHALDPDFVRRLYIFSKPSPTSSLVMRRDLIQGKWSGKALSMDDLVMIYEMIFTHQPRAVLVTERLWDKFCLPDSIAEGTRGRIWDMTWRANDYEVAYQNFHRQMMPEERAYWLTEIVENNQDLGYHYAQEGKLNEAHLHYSRAFRYQPSAKLAIAALRACVKCVLRPTGQRKTA